MKLSDETKGYLFQSLVGFLLGLAICAVITFLTGCKTASHTEKEYITVRDTITKTITEHVTDTKVDTFYLTQVRVDTIWQTTTQTSTAQDFWDNVIFEWTDTLGNKYTQRHETGSRTTTDTSTQTTMQALRDSLTFYKGALATLEYDYDLLEQANSEMELQNITHDTKTEAPSIWSQLKYLPFVLMCMALLSCVVYFVYKKIFNC